jgi:hypothetical protein
MLTAFRFDGFPNTNFWFFRLIHLWFRFITQKPGRGG